MKDFLENIVKNIVDDPDQVVIEESTDSEGRTTLLISVAEGDMGRVIGKAGKVINAIRTVMRIMAIRQGVRIRVDVKDSMGSKDTELTAEPEAPAEVQDDDILVDDATEEKSSESPEVEVEEDTEQEPPQEIPKK